MQTCTLDDILGREGYEALLTRLGGENLARQLDVQRETRLALQATLDGTQRDLFITYADASADACADREAAAVRVNLSVGVAMGAALARFPDAPSDAVMQTAAGAVGAVMGASLPAALAAEIARTALAALQDPR